jgi:hypothetical protein
MVQENDFYEDRIDFREIGRRFAKYLIEGVVVGLACWFIPKRQKDGTPMLSIEEVLMISCVAAAIFAITDMYAPAIGASVKTGAGFGLGAGIVGWPGIGM